VPASPLFLSGDPALDRRVAALVEGLPQLSGDPVRIGQAPGLKDRRGPVHAGSFMRERRIAFDCTRSEFPRIFIHELFHFVWVRLGNSLRREFEHLIAAEWLAGARGELGWSAQWRKDALRVADPAQRSRRWREYVCESFCDTAAWRYSGVAAHPEFTLAERYRSRRRAWFSTHLEDRTLSI
jgi:hypothetical protein